MAPQVPAIVQGEVLDAKAAHDAEDRVKEALRDGKAALWKLSEALYDFDASKGWAALGYENLSQWLADPEIDMTRGTYYRWVNTWRKLAVEKGMKREQLEQVSASKAALIADDVVEGHVRPATALKDVQNLTAAQLRVKYEKPARGRPPAPARSADRVRKDLALTEADRRSQSARSAMMAARDLPWDFVEGVVAGDGNLDLRKARFKEALRELLAWRDQYLA